MNECYQKGKRNNIKRQKSSFLDLYHMCLDHPMVKTHVIRLRGVEGRNVPDQIAFSCAFHSFLVEVQLLSTCMRRMRNNNLEIRIAGSSCRRQLGNNI